MKNKAHDLANYAFQKDEPLLLDTNVWLYLYPAPSDRPTGPCSQLLGRVEEHVVRRFALGHRRAWFLASI